MGSIVDSGFSKCFSDTGSVGSPTNTNVLTPGAANGNTSTGEGVTLVLAISAYGAVGSSGSPFKLSSVTDNAGNAWHYSTAQTNNAIPPAWGAAETQGTDNSFVYCAIAYVTGAKPVTSITSVLTAAVVDFRCTLYEFDQVPYDAVATGAAAASLATGAAANFTTPSITAQSGDFVVAVSTPDDGFEGANSPFTYNWADDLVSAYNASASAGSVSCTFTGVEPPGSGTQFTNSACILSIGGSTHSPLKPGLNRIWPAQPTPGSGRTAAGGGATGILGTQFSVSQICWMTAFWWFAPAYNGGGTTPSPELGLYTVSGQALVPGTHVTGATWNGASNSPGAWIRQPLAAPVQLAASTNYMAAAVVAGNYPQSSSFTWPVTSGIITASQGAFLGGPTSIAYPTNADTANSYFNDIEVSLTNPALGSGALLAAFP